MEKILINNYLKSYVTDELIKKYYQTESGIYEYKDGKYVNEIYLEKDGKPAIHGMGFISEYKITSTKIGFKLPTFLEKVIKGDEESKNLFLLLNWNIFNYLVYIIDSIFNIFKCS